MGHPLGVAAAGGDASKGNLAGITLFERANGQIFWANDSKSLPNCLAFAEIQAVQQGLEYTFPNCTVQQLRRIADVPLN